MMKDWFDQCLLFVFFLAALIGGFEHDGIALGQDPGNLATATFGGTRDDDNLVVAFDMKLLSHTKNDPR
jgi:hypothetical protein